MPFDISKDMHELMELYDTVHNISTDKNNFVRQSLPMMEALKNGDLSDLEEKNRLKYAGEIYASYAAVKMYEESLQGTLNISTEEELTEECPWCGGKGTDITPYYCSPQVKQLEGKQTFPPAKLWMMCTGAISQIMRQRSNMM